MIIEMFSISSREFNQDVGKAKRNAERGPVFITDRGTPAHVLLTIEAYQQLIERSKSVADALSMPESADIDLPIITSSESALREVDLT